MILDRDFTAKRINEIINHPEVRPWVAESEKGVLDMTKNIENKNNILLLGEYGGCFFIKIAAGVYEVHTQVLPEGRGDWAFNAVKNAAKWMFTRTDAYEIVTRIPQTHTGAKKLAISVGMKFEFTADRKCLFREQLSVMDIYSFRIQDWLPSAESFSEKGQGFHEFMEKQADKYGITKDPHGPMPNHNQFLGVCLEMGQHGQTRKGVFIYNRWAVIARHEQIELVSEDPSVIKFDVGYLKMSPEKVEFLPCL